MYHLLCDNYAVVGAALAIHNITVALGHYCLE